MVSIDNTRKHFIPQKYLRGFSCEGNPNQIYVFDKHRLDQGVQVRSIRDVEVARHAYSVENDKILTDFEDRFSPILHWIRSNDASDLNEYISDRERSSSLRAWLARFVVDITLRSRGLRENAPVRALIARGFAEANRQNDELESRIFAQYSDRDDEEPQSIVSALGKIAHLGDIISGLQLSSIPSCADNKARIGTDPTKREVGALMPHLRNANSSHPISLPRRFDWARSLNFTIGSGSSYHSRKACS